MPTHHNLDKIINEFSLTQYGNAITLGVNNFIESCSDSICKEGEALSDNYLHSLLYLLKYLYKYWTNSDKTIRLNKQLCLKALFVILLTRKQIPECAYLLEQSVSQIANCWEINPSEYPFLTKGEEDKVLSKVQAISNYANVHAEFSALNFERTDKKIIFNYCPDKIYDEFIEVYEKFCRNCNLEKEADRFLKSIFIAVSTQVVFDAVPGILRILPFHFCIVEARKLLPKNPEYREIKCMDSMLLNSKAVFAAGNRLLIRGTTEHYESIPKWARWFFLAGQKIAAVGSSGRNLIVGLSLPTRSYAVQFFLLGYETWNAKKTMADQNENRLHFDCLAKCENNEALLIWENEHWKRCWFRGVDTVAGENCIKVEVPGTEARKHLSFVTKAKIPKLRKAVDAEREIAANQTGFGMSGLNSLISYYNKAEDDILKFLNQDKSLFAVIGNISTIKNEMEKVQLYIYQEGKYIKFFCQHIIRFKNFTTEFDFPHGIIFSNRESGELLHHTFPIVVYDGSSAYLSRQGDVQNSVEIVLLDRTEPQFSSARNELMARYYDRSVAVDLFDDVPVSMELIAFKE